MDSNLGRTRPGFDRLASMLGRLCILLTLALVVGGCATGPPHDRDNICAIFHEKSGWYADANKASKRWGAPIPVQMAIIDRESGFRADAKPPRHYILGFIPWGRVSSAYGYTQALDGTWKRYERSSGNGWANRDDFGDSVDFVGWYVAVSHRKLGIPKRDARRQYLAYYLGRAGYRSGAYRHKPHLRRVARGVGANAARYRRQLRGCRADLEQTGHWWWPF